MVRARQDHLGLAASRVCQRASTTPRVAYVGGAGDANLGDEAILHAVRDLLPDVSLVPLSYPRTETRLARARLSGPHHFRAMLLSGGTLINSHFEPRVRFGIEAGVAAWAFGTGAGGAGFGMRDDVDLGNWASMLGAFRGVAVRGPRSAAQLQSIGVCNVEILGDPALWLGPRNALQDSDRPRVLLNVSRPERPDADAPHYDALEQALICMLRPLVAHGWEVVPVAMHRTDLLPTKRVVQGLCLDTVVPLAESAEAFFRLCSGSSVVVCVRLHAAVLACCASVPPLLIGYRDKCADFMESINRGDLLVPFPTGNGEELRAGIERVVERRTELARSIGVEVEAARGRIRSYADRILAEISAT